MRLTDSLETTITVGRVQSPRSDRLARGRPPDHLFHAPDHDEQEAGDTSLHLQDHLRGSHRGTVPDQPPARWRSLRRPPGTRPTNWLSPGISATRSVGEAACVPSRLRATEAGGSLDREHAGGEIQRLGRLGALQAPWDELVPAGGAGVGGAGKRRDAMGNLRGGVRTANCPRASC